VVYVSEQLNNSNQQREREISALSDPALIRSARRIYRTYCFINPKQSKRPFGVAINPENHRGQLIFKSKPILLPGESFIPVKQLESEVY
jgi:hypothetical protein